MAEWTLVEDEEELKRLAAERISVPPPQEDRIPLESELGNEWEKVEEPPQFEKELRRLLRYRRIRGTQPGTGSKCRINRKSG